MATKHRERWPDLQAQVSALQKACEQHDLDGVRSYLIYSGAVYRSMANQDLPLPGRALMLIAAAEQFITRYDYLHGDRPQVMKLEMDEFRDAVSAAKGG